MRDPGPLLASGRDSEIFAYGPGLVLRRSRGRRSMEKEAKVMRYVAARGYPAPRVEELSADGSELVMERIEGPTLLEAVSTQPWTLRRNAATLAVLHDRLHAIPGPEWLDPLPGGGDRLVHLDLHPVNVILSHKGPVLIDWTNAARQWERFLLRQGEILLTGFPTDLALAHLELARLYRRLGDRAGAQGHYRKFLAMWRQADNQALYRQAADELRALTQPEPPQPK